MAAAAEWINLEAQLEKLELDEVASFVETLGPEAQRWLCGPLFDWEGTFARDAQKEPLGAWRVWLIQAGRGYGKTRTGSEWVIKQVENGVAKRIALVGRTSADVRDVMIEGESGILACSPPWLRPIYQPALRRLTWYSSDGLIRAIATAYSADEPALLRGPQHDAAWADELAAWRFPEAWDNLIFGLRLGANPRAVVTTTPKPKALIRDLRKRSSTIVTGGSTRDNVQNLAPAFLEDLEDRYAGTDLYRQEVDAELLQETEGALWKRKWIEENRWNVSTMGPHPDLELLYVGVDPAGSRKETSSETGIIAAGRAQVTETSGPAQGKTRPHYFIVADRSGRYTPNGWGTLSVELYETAEADAIIGEKNNGGDMVEAIVANIDNEVPFVEAWASRGKAPRAAPVANLYEQGRIHHVGGFPELEDQLCNWEPGSGDESPDRLDALVWSLFPMMPTEREPKLQTGLDLGGGELGRESPWKG